MALVWVYGTLRRGETNHALMRDCAYLGQWWSPPIFYLVDLGDYPGIVNGQQSVLGELYIVDDPTLVKLDELEEVPHEYSRERLMTPWARLAITTIRWKLTVWPPFLPEIGVVALSVEITITGKPKRHIAVAFFSSAKQRAYLASL